MFGFCTLTIDAHGISQILFTGGSVRSVHGTVKATYVSLEQSITY
jgi:hypothetical protein